MTIKVLLEQVEKASEGTLPTAKKLEQSGVETVLRHMGQDGTEVCVYRNGYVTYRAGRHVTVFSLHDVSGDYTFEFVSGNKSLDGTDLEDMDCIVRLIMEGEDRIGRNTDVLYGRKKVSYSRESEEWGVMADLRDHVAEAVDRLFVGTLMECFTDRQREYVRRYFFGGEQGRNPSCTLTAAYQHNSSFHVGGATRIPVR